MAMGLKARLDKCWRNASEGAEQGQRQRGIEGRAGWQGSCGLASRDTEDRQRGIV